jgi:Uracil DNA glycosylase superfamily
MKNKTITDTFADKAIKFFTGLKIPDKIPKSIGVLNPYKTKEVKEAVKHFFHKYFNDSEKRAFVFGINPGRFGGGLTGISFTDPVALREECGIENELGDRKELSSKFIYKVINQYGGVKKFYSKIFITALYPLAIIQDGKNYNYYDSLKLYESLKTQIASAIKEQVGFGADRRFAVCLGKKNAKYFNEINKEYNFFEEIRVLDHPRYIMQYRLKMVDHYLTEYMKALTI